MGGVGITKWQRIRITAVMAIAFTEEHADEMLLSAMYLAISHSLDMGPSQLGELSMWRALVQALLVPFIGIAGNMYNRIHLIGLGTILWGSMSLGMAFSHNYGQAALWCALNGVGLALVLPCVQSIIAELYRSRSRGKAFGLIFTISAAGGMVCNFVATTYSRHTIGHLEGWRVMFLAIAAVATTATISVFAWGIEPRKLRPKEVLPGEESDGEGAAVKPMLTFLRTAYRGVRVVLGATRTCFRVPSFQIILAAGIVGAIMGMGYGYKVMYLQLLGFSDVSTATLGLCTTLGLAVGFLMGGFFGDMLAVRFPNAARPFINQVSIALSGPLSIVLYKAMPGCSRYATGIPGSLDRLVPEYGILLFAIGALASWPASNNAAIFADVVPESVRTSVYAFDKCIMGAIGAAATPLAGVLAERVFGFSKPPGHSAGTTPPAPAVAAAHRSALYANNLNNARALENGLVCIMVVPMIIKFLLYFGLYWTLPHDRVIEARDLCDSDSDSELARPPGCAAAAAAAAEEGSAKGGRKGVDGIGERYPGTSDVRAIAAGTRCESLHIHSP